MSKFEETQAELQKKREEIRDLLQVAGLNRRAANEMILDLDLSYIKWFRVCAEEHYGDGGSK